MLQFFETRMGKTFFEGSIPRIIKALEEQNKLLKEQNELMREQIAYLKGEAGKESVSD